MRSTIRYLYNIQLKNNPKLHGFNYEMPKEIQNDQQALDWAKQRMDDLPEIIYGIRRVITIYQQITE